VVLAGHCLKTQVSQLLAGGQVQRQSHLVHLHVLERDRPDACQRSQGSKHWHAITYTLVQALNSQAGQRAQRRQAGQASSKLGRGITQIAGNATVDMSICN
jgi:hypothetical protein